MSKQAENVRVCPECGREMKRSSRNPSLFLCHGGRVWVDRDLDRLDALTASLAARDARIVELENHRDDLAYHVHMCEKTMDEQAATILTRGEKIVELEAERGRYLEALEGIHKLSNYAREGDGDADPMAWVYERADSALGVEEA